MASIREMKKQVAVLQAAIREAEEAKRKTCKHTKTKTWTEYYMEDGRMPFPVEVTKCQCTKCGAYISIK